MKPSVEQISNLLSQRGDLRPEEGYWQDFLREFHHNQRVQAASKPAPLAMLVSANLMAAERIEHQVTVTAQIPTEAFYVQPTGGDNWMSTPQKLAYNPYTKKLDTLSKQLDAKSTIGAITGYLTNPAVMASGKVAGAEGAQIAESLAFAYSQLKDWS